MHIEFRRTNYGKCSLGFKVAIIWNNLPLNIRNITSYKRFKNKVKEYVIKPEKVEIVLVKEVRLPI